MTDLLVSHKGLEVVAKDVENRLNHGVEHLHDGGGWKGGGGGGG